MHEVVKIKHSRKSIQARKYLIRSAMGGLIVILGIMIWMLTPIRQVMVMGVERVLIYINEYTSRETQSEQPFLQDVELDEVTEIDLSDYEIVIKNTHDLWSGELILVNSAHSCRIQQGNDLLSVNGLKNDSYKLVDQEMKLNQTMIQQLNRMMKTFEMSTGKHDMILTSGYRTIEEQEEVLQEKIELLGEEEALEWAMLPKYSEHHTGYAMDMSIYTDQGNYIRYKGQDEYGWINQNCHKYGFIRRYSSDKEAITGVVNEEWHYRYVGIPHAYIIATKNFCFEEYIEYLKQYRYDTKHLIMTCEQGKYEIYFVPSEQRETEVWVPGEESYSISGNNVDGYIVTIEK